MLYVVVVRREVTDEQDVGLRVRPREHPVARLDPHPRLLGGDRLLDEEDAAIRCAPAHQVLRPLPDEVPPEVRKADEVERGSCGDGHRLSRLSECQTAAVRASADLHKKRRVSVLASRYAGLAVWRHAFAGNRFMELLTGTKEAVWTFKT
jgi:hypothetical protein